jgi:hypothetical protein
MTEEKIAGITHFVGLRMEPPFDAIKRELHLARYENGKYQIMFITQYSESEEPIFLKMNLTQEAMEMLSEATFEIMQNRSLHVYK